MDFARNLRGFCVGFARNLILFLFKREREGYKRFVDCTVMMIYIKSLNEFEIRRDPTMNYGVGCP